MQSNRKTLIPENKKLGISTLISVILPVYNCEKFISQSVESILNQSIEDFEFIIINDGSTDNTLEILKDFSIRDHRIRLITRENRGVVSTLNEAILLSTAKWIAIMNADDISCHTRLYKQLNHLENSQIDICGSYIEIFGTTNNHIHKYPLSDSQIKNSLLFESPFANPSVMMRATLAKNLLYREDFSKGAEDYDFWVRAAIVGAKMSNLPEVLLFYRKHDSQMTSLFDSNNQQLSTKVRSAYWSFISQSIPIQKSGINEILKCRSDSKYCKLSQDFMNTFDTLLTNTAIDNHFIIFNSLSGLLYRVAHNNFYAYLFWIRLTRKFNFTKLKHVQYIVFLLYIFKLAPNTNIYNKIRNTFVKIIKY